MPTKEVPYQNYAYIKKDILDKRKGKTYSSEDDLFADLSFPPDLSSLSYVYSGDDKYEKMIFKRPLETTSIAVLFGVGGVVEASFPWREFRKRKWFEAAVVIASLCVHYVEKLIPGYRLCEQNFSLDYIGAFHFNVWRFGEWINVVVDDNLPMFDNNLNYCRAFGNPPEYWGPLLEKTYAKIMQTYEAIEYGNTLDALTDITGAICEFYTPDTNPPEHFFHIIYKSWENRSYMVCWRNNKRLTPAGFNHFRYDGEEFPSMDARMVEVIRLKDQLSWKSLNSGFLERYRPLLCKDSDEYWLSMEDFRCNFGGLVICSGKEPFRLEGFNLDRVYSCTKEAGMVVNNNTSNESDSRHSVSNVVNNAHIEKYTAELYTNKISPRIQEANNEITVKENKQTIKMDTTKKDQFTHNKVGIISPRVDTMDEESIMTILLKQRRRGSENPNSARSHDPMGYARKRSASHANTRLDNLRYDRLQPLNNSISTNSVSSELESTFSTSDISVNIPDHISRENSLTSGCRNLSFPLLHPRTYSTGSLSHLTQSNFLAMKKDSFRSHGDWKGILEHYDKWTKQMTTGSNDMKTNSNNPRICFAINNGQTSDDTISPPPFRGKSHVLISLLQDCRHGPSTANSLLVPIGFGVYKTKSSDKDEKRPLSKLQTIGQFESARDQREVSGRLDLEEGNYVIVPYCKSRGHEGSFLLRMLGDKRTVVGKVGCIVS
ncbi:Calpain-9 [Mizuhopecten yessoensis]|uniref:Calpain-9 n=1 Tax=Mizuhopecten yessoensis TaxID=6573 RepID=A0A210PEN5_MIZYE|nr:Calpain-9 [Mizuhopecten yessoensis]